MKTDKERTMRKVFILLVFSLGLMNQVFANNMTMNRHEPKSCQMIAHACMSAGFKRNGGTGHNFWFDCMKPVVMGKSVSGVRVSPNTVMSCRKAKMAMMHKEMKEMKKSQSMSQ